jgi:hypothetical protein
MYAAKLSVYTAESKRQQHGIMHVTLPHSTHDSVVTYNKGFLIHPTTNSKKERPELFAMHEHYLRR